MTFWKNRHKGKRFSKALRLKLKLKYFPAFIYWLLHSLHTMYPRYSTQLMYLTFLADWKGLAQSGVEVFAKLNVLISRATFYRFKLRLLDTAQSGVKVVCKSNFVWWFDNYTHIRMRKRLRANRSLYAENQWTGIAVVKAEDGLAINLALKKVNNVSLPCVPCNHKRLFTENIHADIVALYTHRKWEDYKIVRYKVQSLPLRISREQRHSEHLRRFYPFDIVDINSSSRDGLLALLALMKTSFPPTTHYTMGTLDQPLYLRTMKVLIVVLCMYMSEKQIHTSK